MSKKIDFDIGKYYKKSTKDRKWFFKIQDKSHGVYTGVYVKESRYEDYITNSDIFHEPEECVEISKEEFMIGFNSALEKIKSKI